MTQLLTSCALVLVFVSSMSAQNLPAYEITFNDAPAAGFYFLNPVKVPNPGGAYRNTQFILDGNGSVVYYRRLPQGLTSSDFKLQPNGWMSYSLVARFFFMDSTFTRVDSVMSQNGILPDGHDIQILPNGHYLLPGFENLTMNLSAYPFFNQNGSPGSPNATVKSGVIQELDADKNVVFEWHAADHFDFGDVDPRQLNSPVNVDWTHFNAVAADDDGNILLSSRHLNEVTKINRADGSVIWRLGGKANQFQFVNDPAAFVAQHDPRRIANGNLTLFDNGFNELPLHPAAAKEYLLDETAFTATLVWEHVENPASFSRALGNVQRLDNGNTLVNYGLLTNGNVLFNVVDSAGNKTFEIRFDDSLTSYRSFFYPQLPWQIARPGISCFQNNGQYFLEAESGHASYRWSNGAVTQAIPVTGPGAYAVFVPKGEGFVGSVPVVVTDPAENCAAVSGAEPRPTRTMSVFPNPATENVTIQFPAGYPAEGVLEIYDLTGRKWASLRYFSLSGAFSVDVAALPPGCYILRAGACSGMFVR